MLTDKINAIKAIKAVIPDCALWGIGGSLMLNLKGINSTPKDIDIICDKTCFSAIKDNFSPFISPITSNGVFCSDRIMSLNLNGVFLDIVCGFKIKTENGIFSLPLNDNSISEVIEKNNVCIPLLSLEDWIFIYYFKKDFAKVKLIEYYWKEHEKNKYLFKKNIQRCKSLKIDFNI